MAKPFFEFKGAPATEGKNTPFSSAKFAQTSMDMGRGIRGIPLSKSDDLE